VKIFSILAGAFLVAASSAGIVADQTASDALRERLCGLILCGADESSAAARDRLTEDPAAALRLFEVALAGDPASPYRWCDLGDALVVAGDLDRARFSFTRALELGTNLPPVLLRVADFDFGVEERQEALASAARILRLTSEYDGAVFQSYDWANLPAAEILDRGLPPGKRAAQAWFQHALESRPAADADAGWTRLMRHGFVDDGLASTYIDFLAKKSAYRTAAEAWAAYLGDRAGEYPNGNALFNGGFESAPTGAILDWRFEPAAGADVARDFAVRRSGKTSLRLSFKGVENLDFHHVSQTASVTRGRYRFQAWIRTEGITTDEGVRFHIFDSESPARLDTSTDAAPATSPWTKLETAFEVPKETTAVKVEIIRRPSLKFDNKIEGTAWVDDVSLARID
jgi:hypothetical protein